MRIFLALISLWAPLWAATCTSTQSGNWTSAATWGGTCVSATAPYAYPNIGDLAVVANTHTVATDQDITVGDSSASSRSYFRSVTVTDGGSGLSGACTVAVSGSNNQGFSCTISGGVVTAVTLNAPRIWYAAATSQPTLTIKCGGSTCDPQPTLSVDWYAGVSGSGLAINLNASGKVTIGSGLTLTSRGDIRYTAAAANQTDGLTFNSGAHLVFDSSQATGTKPVYGYGPSTGDGYRKLVASCSAESRCSISSDAEGEVAAISNWGNARATPITLDYVDVTRMGDSTISWLHIYPGTNNGTTHFSIQHSTFTDSGGMSCVTASGSMATLGGPYNFTYTDNTHINTQTTVVLAIHFTSAKTTGSSTISRNVFDKPVWPVTNQGYAVDVVMEDNYAGGGMYPGLGSVAWGSYARNFSRTSTAQINTSAQYVAGLMHDSYHYFDEDIANWHLFRMAATVASTISGMIVGMGGTVTAGGDSGELALPIPAPATLTSYYASKILVLPAANGYGYASIMSTTGCSANVNAHYTNNTWFGGMPPTSGGGFGAFTTNESTATPAGVLQELKYNIIYNPLLTGYSGAGSFPIVTTYLTSSLNADVLVAGGGDYNWSWNASPLTEATCTDCANQGRYYHGKFSVTPGAHDYTGNPIFAGWQRNMELFSSEYLGYSVSNHPVGETWSAWTAEGTYALGDFVTASDAGTYWGKTINYRCINAAGCSGALQPGVVGTAWRTYWEWDSLYRLRQKLGHNYAAVNADAQLDRTKPATCTSSGVNIICQMMSWIQGGFIPQARYCGPGGIATIGAVDFCGQAQVMLGATL